MEMIEIIKKQEAQCKLSLTETEREAVAAFFTERKAEQKALDAVNHAEICDNSPTVTATLREDIPSPNADRKAFLDASPHTDGAFVLVPRAL